MKKFMQIRLYPFQAFTWHLLMFILGVTIASIFYNILAYNCEICIFTLVGLLFVAMVNRILHNNTLTLISWLSITACCAIFFSLSMFNKYFPELKIDNQQITVSGTVTNDPYISYKNQELIVRTEFNSSLFYLLAKVPRNYRYQVGEKIELSGVIKKPGMIEDFDYQSYLRAKKVSYVMLNTEHSHSLSKTDSAGIHLMRHLYSIKHFFESHLNRIFHEPQASLAAGILTGAKRSMPQELSDVFKRAGLSHIIVLSGYNVSIIIIAFSALVAPIANRKIVFILCAIMVILFVLMTGASSSVVRAGIFALMILAGKTLGKQAYLPNILLFTAVIMLLLNPFLLWFDIGFQLSFLAFVGIVYLSKPLKKTIAKSLFKNFPPSINKVLIETLSAQLMVLPLLSYNFGQISLIAPLSNIMILWMIPLAMLSSFISALGSIIALSIGQILAVIAWPLLWYIQYVAEVFTKIPFAMVNAGKHSFLFSFTLYLLLVFYYIKYYLKYEKTHI